MISPEKPGVSTATVTRVTSGSPYVKASTRERVQQIIDECGYVPSAAAHNLEGSDTRTIGIVMPAVVNPYFDRIYNTVYEVAGQNGYYAFLMRINESQPIPRELIDEIIRRRMDGVIFAGNIWSSRRSGLTDALGRLRGHMPRLRFAPPQRIWTASAFTAIWSVAHGCRCGTCMPWGTGESLLSAGPCS